jgi:hypothetical protein
MVIAKYPNDTANPNLLTRASFQELIDLERLVLNETYLEMDWYTDTDLEADIKDAELEVTYSEEYRTYLEDLRANFPNRRIYWEDICTLETIASPDSDDSDSEPREPLCDRGLRPLNFIFELESGEYNLTRYDTNSKLLGKI